MRRFVNFDLLRDPREMVQEQIVTCLSIQKLTVNGPFKLVQGNNGLVARKALYQKDVFLGAYIRWLDLDDILNKSGVVRMNNHDLVMAIRIPGQPAFYGSDNVFQGQIFYEHAGAG